MTERSGSAHVEVVNQAFHPAVLLPTQQPRCRTATPEEALSIAVLEDAIRCIHKYRGTVRASKRGVYRETEEWFLSEQQSWPFAFERICSLLQLDPECVRRALGLRAGPGRG
jgi:hypothetical protein